MVRIVVMDWKGFSSKVRAELETGVSRGKFRRNGDVIHAETLEAGIRALTCGRLALLSMVKQKKPASIYQLAKELGKDIKTVHTDATMLSEMGLLSFEPHKENGKTSLRPKVKLKKITLELLV
jgi:predicted transcriptional regulator